jgi:hypothetical protein
VQLTSSGGRCDRWRGFLRAPRAGRDTPFETCGCTPAVFARPAYDLPGVYAVQRSFGREACGADDNSISCDPTRLPRDQMRFARLKTARVPDFVSECGSRAALSGGCAWRAHASHRIPAPICRGRSRSSGPRHRFSAGARGARMDREPQHPNRASIFGWRFRSNSKPTRRSWCVRHRTYSSEAARRSLPR